MTTEAEQVAKIVKSGMREAQVLPIEQDGVRGQVLLVPDAQGGLTLHGNIQAILDHFRTAPLRRKGTAVMSDVTSFIAHVNRFRDSDSAVFVSVNADDSAATMIAILDYHRTGSDGAPRFGGHRVQYDFPTSDEWQAWQDPEIFLSQDEFAAFIEEHLADVQDPLNAKDQAKAFSALYDCQFASPSTLLKLSRGLAVHVNNKVANHTTLESGERSIAFETTHTDGGGRALQVPRAFLVAIPVFESGLRYQIPVRLRYRVQGGAIVWSWELYRAKDVFKDALRDDCTTVEDETTLPLYYGVAEQ